MPMSNFHARTAGGANFPSKKSLREAIAADPTGVMFTDTSAFNNRGTITADQLKPADMIVGPDPYVKRDWYANVKPNAKTGALRVV